jgi:hypothetical protein
MRAIKNIRLTRYSILVLVMPGCSASSQCKRDNITLTYSPPAPTPAETCFTSTFSYVCPEPALVKRSHLR